VGHASRFPSVAAAGGGIEPVEKIGWGLPLLQLRPGGAEGGNFRGCGGSACLRGAGRGGGANKHRHQFVPAKSGEKSSIGSERAQSLGGLAEERIPGREAVKRVGLFEADHVDEHAGDCGRGRSLLVPAEQ